MSPGVGGDLLCSFPKAVLLGSRKPTQSCSPERVPARLAPPRGLERSTAQEPKVDQLGGARLPRFLPAPEHTSLRIPPSGTGTPALPRPGATLAPGLMQSLQLQSPPERPGAPPSSPVWRCPAGQGCSWEFPGGQGSLRLDLSIPRELVLGAFDLGRLWPGVLFLSSSSCSLVKSHLCAPGCDG